MPNAEILSRLKSVAVAELGKAVFGTTTLDATLKGLELKIFEPFVFRLLSQLDVRGTGFHDVLGDTCR